MPELPEVQTVVTVIRPRLLGRTISRVDLRRRDILDPIKVDLSMLLIGRLIADVHRRGKRIVIRLDDWNQFYIHLGMTGRVSLDEPATELPAHTHLVLDVISDSQSIDGIIQLRFSDPRRFGGVFWLGKSRLRPGDMGPEPLSM